MKIYWHAAVDRAAKDLMQRVESLGYAAIPESSAGADENVLWGVCLPERMEQALDLVGVARRMAPPGAVLLAAGIWTEPSEIGQVLAAGADDYISLTCETRALAARLLSLQYRLERHSAAPEQKLLEERLRHAQRLETLGTLAGAIAHDYNNLLSAIQGNAQLSLMDRNLAAGLRHSLTEIDRAAQRAGNLTRQMLAYARNPDRGGPQTLSLNQLIQETSELLRVSAPRNCTVKYCLAQNVPPVSGQASLLRQLVLNLVLNACKSMGEDGGELKIRTVFDEEADPAMLALEVEGSGPDMPQEELARLFDPLIAQTHGGAIQVISRPGAGPCFRVTLPPIPEWRAERNTVVETPAEGGPARTVLLVDDEEAVRGAAEKLLRRAGYTVFEADNGAEALALCEQVGTALDAVILDLSMPGMKPKELVRGIRSLHPEMRIVVWSGSPEESARERLGDAGQFYFVEKQPQMSAFVEALNGLLRSDGGDLKPTGR